MRLVFPFSERRENVPDILRHQLVLVADVLELIRGVNEERVVVRLALLEDNDAGGDGDAKEEIAWQLDDGIYEVVVDEVFADFLLGTATIEDTGELDDGGGAGGR